MLIAMVATPSGYRRSRQRDVIHRRLDHVTLLVEKLNEDALLDVDVVEQLDEADLLVAVPDVSLALVVGRRRRQRWQLQLPAADDDGGVSGGGDDGSGRNRRVGQLSDGSRLVHRSLSKHYR